MKITKVQSKDEFFEEYLQELLSTPLQGLPAAEQKIGSAVAGWHETEPGVARIYVIGSGEDRVLAEKALREQLEACGYRQASYSLDWDHSDESLIKEAAWADVEANAKWLVQNGKVQIIRNGVNNIVGYVQSQTTPGQTYQVEIGRDDPNSQAITTWECDCPWDQFAWNRTRQWKKYEGRVCKHTLAVFWASRSLPLDEEYDPHNQGPMPPTGPMPMPAGQGPQMGIDILPQFPMANPDMMPQVNPISVPGQKPQTPLNPIQNPGTLSSWQFKQPWDMEKVAVLQNGQMAQMKEPEMGVAEGKSEDHGSGQYREIPRNAIVEVLGEVAGYVDVIWSLNEGGPLEPYHVRAWVEASKLIPRPDIKPPGPVIRRKR